MLYALQWHTNHCTWAARSVLSACVPGEHSCGCACISQSCFSCRIWISGEKNNSSNGTVPDPSSVKGQHCETKGRYDDWHVLCHGHTFVIDMNELSVLTKSILNQHSPTRSGKRSILIKDIIILFYISWEPRHLWCWVNPSVKTSCGSMEGD